MPEDTTTTDATSTTTDERPDDIEKMRAALTKANDEAKKYRHEANEAKTLRTQLEQLQQQTMTDTEKAVAAAKAEGRQEALSTANERLVRAEVRAAAGSKLADPSDAAALLGDLSRFVDKDGEVDDKAISRAIDDLVKAKPYLGAAARNRGSADGGSRSAPDSEESMDTLIRNRMRR